MIAMTVATLSARDVALEVLQAVLRRRRRLDEALTGHPGVARLASRDRAFARLVVATALRRLGQIDGLIDHCLDHPLPHKAHGVRDVLRLGLAQLVFLGTPAHAAVDTTVTLAEAHRHGPHKGLVNALLRRIAREGAALCAAQDAARLNTPDWLWRSWSDAYGQETCRAIAEAHLSAPPLDITVKGDPRNWAEWLDAMLLPTGSLRRPGGSSSAPAKPGVRDESDEKGSAGMEEEGTAGAVCDLPGFAAGAWWVQDAAAALPARLLGDVRGRTVLDLCAAPGGKTAQLAAHGAQVVAVDLSKKRLDRVRENLDRLRLPAEFIVADAAEWRPDAPAQAMLLDAPCSGTGTLRRHPDIAHLKSAEDVGRLADLQDRLLRNAAGMLAPGGVLVYAVCSLQPEEGEARIAGLLAAGAPLKRVPVEPAEIGGVAEMVTKDGDLRTLPCHFADRGGIDGFYAARLQRVG